MKPNNRAAEAVPQWKFNRHLVELHLDSPFLFVYVIPFRFHAKGTWQVGRRHRQRKQLHVPEQPKSDNRGATRRVIQGYTG